MNSTICVLRSSSFFINRPVPRRGNHIAHGNNTNQPCLYDVNSIRRSFPFEDAWTYPRSLASQGLLWYFTRVKQGSAFIHFFLLGPSAVCVNCIAESSWALVPHHRDHGSSFSPQVNAMSNTAQGPWIPTCLIYQNHCQSNRKKYGMRNDVNGKWDDQNNGLPKIIQFFSCSVPCLELQTSKAPLRFQHFSCPNHSQTNDFSHYWW